MMRRWARLDDRRGLRRARAARGRCARARRVRARGAEPTRKRRRRSSAPHLRGTGGGRTATSAVVARRRRNGGPSAWRAERRWTERDEGRTRGERRRRRRKHRLASRRAPTRAPRRLTGRARAHVCVGASTAPRETTTTGTRGWCAPRGQLQDITRTVVSSEIARASWLTPSPPSVMPLIEEPSFASAPGDDTHALRATPSKRIMEKEWERRSSRSRVEQEAGADDRRRPRARPVGEQSSCTTTPTCTTTGATARTAPLSADALGWNTAYRAHSSTPWRSSGTRNDALRGFQNSATVRLSDMSKASPGEARGRTPRRPSRGVRARQRGGGRACSAASARSCMSSSV